MKFTRTSCSDAIFAFASLLLLASVWASAQEGPPAYAGIILVEGNPLQDGSVLADYDNTIKIVIKDDEIYQSNL